jgi:hypothetical protein
MTARGVAASKTIRTSEYLGKLPAADRTGKRAEPPGRLVRPIGLKLDGDGRVPERLQLLGWRRQTSVSVPGAWDGQKVLTEGSYQAKAPRWGGVGCRRRDSNSRHADYDSAALTS